MDGDGIWHEDNQSENQVALSDEWAQMHAMCQSTN